MSEINFLLVGQACLGIFLLFTVGWLLSENRREVDFKTAAGGLIVQIILAYVITHIGVVRSAFLWMSDGVYALRSATNAGTSFVFGYIGGGDLPFELKAGANAFCFGFNALPMVMVVSALSMLLFHWGFLQVLVKVFSYALRKTLGIGGALGVCSAAKVFLGQTEAPLLIRPYLMKLSRSELLTVMTAGMSTTAASLMVLYSTILENTISNPVSHILTASIISIPAAITISRILVPHSGDKTSGDLKSPYEFSSSMDAVSQGATDGMKLFLNIIAMLIVVLALVNVVNALLSLLPTVGGEVIDVQTIFGVVMAPVTWLMGIPWSESIAAGKLLGTKTAINEVIAFISLSELPQGVLSTRTDLIMTYALCGFANFSSIGIQIGGLGAMVPERRQEIISLGFKAMAAGTIASCLSGSIIGLLWWLT